VGRVVSSFLGRSDEERRALSAIIEQEDRVFRLQPGEERDHAVHVRADVPRFLILNARDRLIHATFERKSDRNFYALIGIGIVLFIKTGVSWTEVFKFFAGL
jgi:hypothetical protein